MPISRVRTAVFRNREGTAVDPVPFLVVSGLSLLGSLSFVPVYCLTLGLSMPLSLGVGGAVFLCLSAAAYYRMVWMALPDLRGEVPPAVRLQRLVYGALAVAGVLSLLTLLLLSR